MYDYPRYHSSNFSSLDLVLSPSTSLSAYRAPTYDYDHYSPHYYQSHAPVRHRSSQLRSPARR